MALEGKTIKKIVLDGNSSIFLLFEDGTYTRISATNCYGELYLDWSVPCGYDLVLLGIKTREDYKKEEAGKKLEMEKRWEVEEKAQLWRLLDK